MSSFRLSHLHKLLDPEIRAKNLQWLRWRARELYWSTAHPAMPDPVFVIGCSRSGTTVTFETLAASGQYLHFDYELPQLWDGLYGPLNNGWASEAAGPEHAERAHRERALAYFYARLGAGPVLDKTCINTLRVAYLHKLFPRAKFVFIHRDGRDNISSMIDGWRLGRTDGGFGLEKFFGPSPVPVEINGGEFREWHFFLPPGWRDYNRASLEEVCAFQWISANRLALDAARDVPAAQWIQVRYEDISSARWRCSAPCSNASACPSTRAWRPTAQDSQGVRPASSRARRRSRNGRRATPRRSRAYCRRSLR
jgi:hypothetical protein